MKKFVLYGTGACHLCEVAQGMLVDQLAGQGDYAMDVVDISESDELYARYGLTIPVLQHPDERELGWPFSAQQLHDFLAS